MPDDRLTEYRGKRNAARTREPIPDPGSLQATGEGATFVVQEHHARSLHWDFRLERDGVLVSWAVPKGIPADPRTNHLAVHTEDHPLEYATFEGTIAAGEYGGGEVIHWDSGTYETEKWTDREVKVVLHGRRSQGRFVLFRTHGKNWMMHRMGAPATPDWQPLPGPLRPMRATPGRMPARTQDERWAYEMYWEGVRALVYVEGGRATVVSGSGDDVSPTYPELRKLGESLGATQTLLDGVIVSLGGGPTYFAVDLLHHDGSPLLAQPYSVRRARLEAMRFGGANWRVPPAFVGNGPEASRVCREQGLPGLIAKRLSSPYRPDQTTPDWRSIIRARSARG